MERFYICPQSGKKIRKNGLAATLFQIYKTFTALPYAFRITSVNDILHHQSSFFFKNQNLKWSDNTTFTSSSGMKILQFIFQSALKRIRALHQEK